MRLPRGLSFFLLLVLFASGCQRPAPEDPRMHSPAALMKDALSRDLKRIFVNPRARPGAADPAFVATSPEDAIALRNPSLWRKLDRAQRFDGVVLAGATSEFEPLLDHLTDSPDFRLARVDNWGFLFVRGIPTPYVPPAISAIGSTFPNSAQRSIYLSQMALMLGAAHLVSPASDYMEAALKGAPKEPSVQVRAAALAFARKRYPEALQYVARALEMNPHDPSALEVEARTYAALGAHEQAWAAVTELKDRAPADDMNVLFLHAHLADAAHAYADEQTSLEALIRLAEKQNLPATDYHVYLGQCYARQGLARVALQQFDLALKDPTLSEQQRADLVTAAATVSARSGGYVQ